MRCGRPVSFYEKLAQLKLHTRRIYEETQAWQAAEEDSTVLHLTFKRRKEEKKA